MPRYFSPINSALVSASSGAQPVLGCDALEHRLGVVEQAARGRSVLRVIEDGGKLADQLPGGEERRPVDVVAKLGDRIIVKHARADEARPRRDVVSRPVEL